MQRILVLIVTLILAVWTFPAGAHCGACEEDVAAEKAAPKAKGGLEDRVAALEVSLKDATATAASSGQPLTSKAQGSKAKVRSHTQKGS